MIRHAKATEFQILTEISFASKMYWEYPAEYLDIWRGELTITAEYIEHNLVYVFENKHDIIGYYSIVEIKKDLEISGIILQKGYWLEHMFLLPKNIGEGIGTKMFTHIYETCLSKGIHRLGILADPNARGFYEKMGCQYQKEYPSVIPNRTTPLLILKISTI